MYKNKYNYINKHQQQMEELVSDCEFQNFIGTWSYDSNTKIPTLVMGTDGSATAYIRLLASAIGTISEIFHEKPQEIIKKLQTILEEENAHNREKTAINKVE